MEQLQAPYSKHCFIYPDGQPGLLWFSPHVVIESSPNALILTEEGPEPVMDSIGVRLHPRDISIHNGKDPTIKFHFYATLVRNGRVVIWTRDQPFWCWTAFHEPHNRAYYQSHYLRAQQYANAIYPAMQAVSHTSFACPEMLPQTLARLREVTVTFADLIPQAVELIRLPDIFLVHSCQLEIEAIW